MVAFLRGLQRGRTMRCLLTTWPSLDTEAEKKSFLSWRLSEQQDDSTDPRRHTLEAHQNRTPEGVWL